jgi:hypothetical protein
VTLGQRIVRELGLENSVDTLGRWLAHRIAELMERAEQGQAEVEREAAKRECAELILRVWERRRLWQRGFPLDNLSAFIEIISSESPQSQCEIEGAPRGSWLDALSRLRKLREREDLIVLDATIADLNLEQERQWLSEHSGELSEEERQTIIWTITQQDRLNESNFKLDGKDASNFGLLPPTERAQIALEALIQLQLQRQALLAAVEREYGCVTIETDPA